MKRLRTSMLKTHVFEEHAAEYDHWYEEHPQVFVSEVEALRIFLPAGNSSGIEVGLGTGRFAQALGIKEGVEPVEALRKMAVQRGIEVMDGIAERLPYKDMRFDFVLMATCVSYLASIPMAFSEAHRVLKPGGTIIVGFIEKDSVIGRAYEAKRQQSTFYKTAIFYTAESISEALKQAGFKNLRYAQTLFRPLESITMPESVLSGYGQGSYIVVSATKQK